MDETREPGWVVWAEGVPWGVRERRTAAVAVRAPDERTAAIRGTAALVELYGSCVTKASTTKVRAEGEADGAARDWWVGRGYLADPSGEPGSAPVANGAA